MIKIARRYFLEVALKKLVRDFLSIKIWIIFLGTGLFLSQPRFEAVHWVGLVLGLLGLRTISESKFAGHPEP